MEGIAVLANKRYYFGVGGGMHELEQIIATEVANGAHSSYEVVSRYSIEDGQSNIRDIVVLKRTR